MAAVTPRVAARRRPRLRTGLLAAATLVLLGGCAPLGNPPVAERSPVFGDRPDSYRVEPGDTLYSIAWRFELDHRALARANGIAPPYVIHPGQRLRLTAAEPPAPAAAPPAAAVPPRRRVEPSLATGWRPPTDAPLLRGFGDGNEGLDYRLGADHQVWSAAAGEVVYAGSGLGGFRHLVIVKHDPRHLSAYSFDRVPAVDEGQRIKAGAPLADNHSGGRRPGTLHFEIRKDGDPLDPRMLIGSGA